MSEKLLVLKRDARLALTRDTSPKEAGEGTTATEFLEKKKPKLKHGYFPSI
jgi:hypothetical protein